MRKIVKLEEYQPLSRIASLFVREENTVLLESSLQGSLGQYSILARKPYLMLEKRRGKLYVNQEEQEEGFSEFLNTYLKDNREDNPTKLPLVDGALGFLSYDFLSETQDDFPQSLFYFYDELIIEDHVEKAIYLIANGKKSQADEAIQALECKIQNLEEEQTTQTQAVDISIHPNFEKEEYKNAVLQMINYIIEGDIYIANMTQRLEIQSTRKPYEAYERLCKQNPAPFAAYLNYPGLQVVSASPERFLQVKNGTVITRPIKGTRKRGETPEEDEALKEELKQSEKDKSELLMIVDLLRNDLNRVCIPGSVRVDELFAIESYATVHHLLATISGQLEPEKTVVDLLDAAFPGGSITGAPKIRAMEIIAELERGRRGLYTGSIGYISLNGDCDFNIVIRTAVHQNGVYQLGVGGGITCESEPEFEYEETLQKARAILRALS